MSRDRKGSGLATARCNELVAAAYERGKTINAGASFAFDDVIDPAHSRRWITKMLASVPAIPPGAGKNCLKPTRRFDPSPALSSLG